MSKDVFILGGKRTPMGEYVGVLKDISAIDLGAVAARGALEATRVKPEEIDHTVMGNALQTSGDAIYGARHVALKAGVPFDRPALTVNRLCGSGIQSIVSGAHMLQLGEAESCLVGGIESMSQAPHVIRGARSGFALGQGKLEDSLMVALLDTYCNTPMAGTAENLARKFEISREEQDKYALRSQQEAKRALDAGYLAEEIVPVEIKSRKGSQFVDKDDHPRPETTLEILAKLKPAFAHDGFVTAGNASGIVDGAAALVIASEDFVKQRDLNADGPDRQLGLCRCRTGDHGHRSGACDARGTRKGRLVTERHRSHRGKRGFRRPIFGCGKRARTRSLAHQRQRRRDCARSSVGSDRNAAGFDVAA